MNNLLFNSDEYQLYNDNNEDYYFEDTKTMYYNEMAKYSLLTDEEEYQLGKILHDPEKKKLLLIKRSNHSIITELNIAILFNSLCNNKSYKDILNNIIDFYSRLNSNNDKTIDIIKKYLIEANKVNRALNKDELLNIFKINDEVALDEKTLLYEIKEFMNYKYAYDKMFLSNLRLVASIASNYHSNIDFMDLVNEGNLGLMRAIYGYDVTLGNKFSTYATYWIKFYIRRAAINSYRMIKVPEQVLYDAFKLRDKIMKLENETGKTLSIDEIANELDVSVDVIKECKVIMNEEMSLDQKIGDNEDTELREMIASNYSLEEECFKLVLKDDIEVLLSNLSDREIQVIKMHYGLGEFCDNPISISKISEIFNVSQQRINQIKLSALFKMKRMALRNRKLAAIKEYIK